MSSGELTLDLWTVVAAFTPLGTMPALLSLSSPIASALDAEYMWLRYIARDNATEPVLQEEADEETPLIVGASPPVMLDDAGAKEAYYLAVMRHHFPQSLALQHSFEAICQSWRARALRKAIVQYPAFGRKAFNSKQELVRHANTKPGLVRTVRQMTAEARHHCAAALRCIVPTGVAVYLTLPTSAFLTSRAVVPAYLQRVLLPLWRRAGIPSPWIAWYERLVMGFVAPLSPYLPGSQPLRCLFRVMPSAVSTLAPRMVAAALGINLMRLWTEDPTERRALQKKSVFLFHTWATVMEGVVVAWISSGVVPLAVKVYSIPLSLLRPRLWGIVVCIAVWDLLAWNRRSRYRRLRFMVEKLTRYATLAVLAYIVARVPVEEIAFGLTSTLHRVCGGPATAAALACNTGLQCDGSMRDLFASKLISHVVAGIVTSQIAVIDNVAATHYAPVRQVVAQSVCMSIGETCVALQYGLHGGWLWRGAVTAVQLALQYASSCV
jgi:hypothetical protein